MKPASTMAGWNVSSPFQNFAPSFLADLASRRRQRRLLARNCRRSACNIRNRISIDLFAGSLLRSHLFSIIGSVRVALTLAALGQRFASCRLSLHAALGPHPFDVAGRDGWRTATRLPWAAPQSRFRLGASLLPSAGPLGRAGGLYAPHDGKRTGLAEKYRYGHRQRSYRFDHGGPGTALRGRRTRHPNSATIWILSVGTASSRCHRYREANGL